MVCLLLINLIDGLCEEFVNNFCENMSKVRIVAAVENIFRVILKIGGSVHIMRVVSDELDVG